MHDETARGDDPDSSAGNAAENAPPADASELEKADIEIGTKLASHRDHPAVKAAGIAGKIGDQGPLYALSAGLLICGLAAKDRRFVGSGVAMLAAITAADLGKSGIKHAVSRTRPNVLLDQNRYDLEAGGSDDKPEQSFPSGHMAGSVAVARAVSRNFPKAGALAGLGAIGIGLSRVAKGAHWPLDVAGGAVVGLVAEELTTGLLRLVLPHCSFAELEPDTES